MSEKNKKKSGLILSCWIVAALIVLIAFLVNGNTIVGNLKSTGFFERVFGTTPEFVKNHKDEVNPESNGLLEVEIENSTPSSTPSDTTLTTPQTQDTEQEKLSVEVNTQTSELQNKDDTDDLQEPEVETYTAEVKPEKQEPKPTPAPQAVTLHVCFVMIDSDGSINKKETTRTTTKRDAPLSAALEALLSGPTMSERNSNYMTLIPSGTRLLGASVKNGIATLNFSEEFEFNTYGVEGYLGQLMQIVYTATAFSTVDSVQFLIEGQKHEYLGSEGVWIGSPLARSTFK